MDVAIVGGTGAEGFGLALRVARAGRRVVIGSRDASRGADAAARANEILGGGDAISGASNEEAAERGDPIVVTVPYGGQAEIYRSIAPKVPAGRIVVDATSPLATAVGGRAWQVIRPWHGSAAEQARALLPDRVRVVAAFHTIAAESLRQIDEPMDSDVLVCGDDVEAKRTVGSLIDQIPGLRWVDTGPLSMARIAEPITALLVSVNRTYEVRDAGFRVTGRDSWGMPPG